MEDMLILDTVMANVTTTRRVSGKPAKKRHMDTVMDMLLQAASYGYAVAHKPAYRNYCHKHYPPLGTSRRTTAGPLPFSTPKIYPMHGPVVEAIMTPKPGKKSCPAKIFSEGSHLHNGCSINDYTGGGSGGGGGGGGRSL
ncbi:hypothetical protein GQR58_001781 [Nymphon striatum]|nr:hypothetical protein GQR58_001781 [Nymphon striatum]